MEELRKARSLVCLTVDCGRPRQEKENLRELYALINRLGKLERALILLWLGERSYEEIAEILDISVSNVGVRINRIKAKLTTMSNN